MQNEERINGLENQVRTLKRIVCLVCCLFVCACSTPYQIDRDVQIDRDEKERQDYNFREDATVLVSLAVQSWNGYKIKDALSVFGPPNQAFRNEGTTYYEWFVSGILNTSAEIHMEVSEGVINRVRWEGQFGAYKAIRDKAVPGFDLKKNFDELVLETGAPWRK